MDLMKNTEIVKALETGAMPDPRDQFNPAPSGRPEFGQVYVIPACLREQILAALQRKAAPAPKTVPKVKGKQPE